MTKTPAPSTTEREQASEPHGSVEQYCQHCPACRCFSVELNGIAQELARIRLFLWFLISYSVVVTLLHGLYP